MHINKNLFLFIFLFSLISCSEVNDEPNDTSSSIIWNGSLITFEKSDGADPTAEANQDRLTSNVWITRGNNGGQIYNIAKENTSNKDNSPTGTAWAIGTLDQIESLSFNKFRVAVGNPKDVVGKDLVMHLIEDDIYLSVKFSSWSSGQKGGFAYSRSTSN
tara:strand:- start:9051 stop:9530 length:480 start_codon:yes stop_codon:yes gene_type:complete